jgi:hypothetical protein
MYNSKATVQTKSNLLSLFHKYRTKIALSLFLVLTPLLLIVIGYLSPYLQSTRVTFDLEVTEESVYVRNFKSINELDDITLYVDWLRLTKPTENEDGSLSNGSMEFRITYEAENNKDINDVTVTLVIQPQFSSSRDISQPRVILPFGMTTSNTIFKINHNLLYPYNPMFLVTVTDPILYLRITYNEVLSDRIDPVSVTEYVSIRLSELNPERVN